MRALVRERNILWPQSFFCKAMEAFTYADPLEMWLLTPSGETLQLGGIQVEFHKDGDIWSSTSPAGELWLLANLPPEAEILP